MLYIVLKGGSHKVLKAILCYVIVILITGLVSGIAGFVIAVKDAFDNPDMAKEDLASSIIDQLMPLMYALSGVYLIASAILARKSYNLLAKGQVKNSDALQHVNDARRSEFFDTTLKELFKEMTLLDISIEEVEEQYRKFLENQ